jgi:hypothetical protein
MKALSGIATAMAFTMALAPPATAAKPATGVDPMQASAWEIGPITPTANYSVNMPLTPAPHPDGWFFDFPQPDKEAGHVHYLTFRHGSLTGKSRIVMRYRIEADPGVQFYPTNFPGSSSTLTLYFQRRGDDWSGRGKYEGYRWWATFRSVSITPGEHELSVGLDETWTAVGTSTAANNSKAFRDAIRDAERVGFTFGGGDGYGHGVYATGPARFVLTRFEIVSETDFGLRSAAGAG